jgi:hypothetical protein
VITENNTQLPNLIDHYDPLVITWSCSVNAGVFEEIGDSQNEAFLICGTPGAPMYHTVVQISCKNAKGIGDLATQEQQKGMIDTIFDDFTDKVVTNARDHIMKYYGGTPVPTSSGFSGFLTLADGRCGEWAVLFRYAVLVQDKNIAISHVQVLPKPDMLGFTINDSGQGGCTPFRRDFEDHAIVKFGTTYYDPSYGIVATGLLGWQNAVVDQVIDSKMQNINITDTTTEVYVKENNQ